MYSVIRVHLMFLVLGCKIFLVGGDYWGEVHSVIDPIIVFDIGSIEQYLLRVGRFLSSGFGSSCIGELFGVPPIAQIFRLAKSPACP